MEKKEKVTVMKRSDYTEPDFTAIDVDLTFDLDDEKTVVNSIVRYVRKTENLKAPLILDTAESIYTELDDKGIAVEKSLIKKIKVNGVALDVASKSFISNLKNNFIEIPSTQALEYTVEIENEINPSKNSALMGLYKSNGVFCTQCEPQGFRRITPFLDRSDVLATYKVTILGPLYGCGVLLSNGNLIEQGTRDGRNYAVWQDIYPKPSYLFALVAGTFDIITDEYKTSSGKKVELNLYVDRGCYNRGLHAMKCIKESMAWDEQRFSLEYDLNIFNVVAVDFFNFGAMENKSLNIFNSVYVLVDPASATDKAFFNVQSVIGHEYFHNYTGDRVTLRDWFQLSLKESLTVFRDQEFSSDVASRTLTRLSAISVIRGRQFAEDASPMAHPIRPEQVMEMDNFYSVTIYDKGAEVIRMIYTLLGREKFKQALRFYLSKFDGQAVTIEDFLLCMESSGDIDLTQFRRWYTQSGTPTVSAQWKYDTEKEKLVLTLSQHTAPNRDQAKKEPFFMPVRISFLDKAGNRVYPQELPEELDKDFIILKEDKQIYEFTVAQGVLPVILRDFSAPVKLDAPYTLDNLQHLLSYCDDAFIKVDAAVSMQNQYIHKNIDIANGNYPAPLELIESYRELLKGASASNDLHLLAETLRFQSVEAIMQTFEKVDIDAIGKVRKALKEQVAVALYDDFVKVYSAIRAPKTEYTVDNMAKRSVNNIALDMIVCALVAKGSKAEASALVLKHYNRSHNMTDCLQAMTEAVNYSLECKEQILKEFDKAWSKDPLVMDNFFRVQASAEDKSVIETVRSLQKHHSFNGSNPNRVRALFGAFSQNPLVLHDADGKGYRLICDEIQRVKNINYHVAAALITPLLSFRRFDLHRQKLIREVLEEIRKSGNNPKAIVEKINSALDVEVK